MTFKQYIQESANLTYQAIFIPVIDAIKSDYKETPKLINIPIIHAHNINSAIDEYIRYSCHKKHQFIIINDDFAVLGNESGVYYTIIISSNFPFYSDLNNTLVRPDVLKQLVNHGSEAFYDYLKQLQANQELSTDDNAIFDRDFLDGINN